MRAKKLALAAVAALCALAAQADAQITTPPAAVRITAQSPISVSPGSITLGGSFTLSCPSCAVLPDQTGQAGKVLGTDGATTSWVPSVSSLSGDVTGAGTSNTVVAFQNRSFASTAPSTNQAIAWNGSSWAPTTLTQDMIGAAFTVTLAASGFSTVQQCGATITNPQFTDSHNQTPATASVQDNTDTQSISPPTATALGYGGAANTFGSRSYTCSTVNCTRAWTYSATNSGGVTKTASVTATYEVHIYYGMAVPGTIDSAFITSLPSSTLASGSVPLNQLSYGAGLNSKKAYLAIRHGATAPTTFKDHATGFGIPFSLVASSVSVANECGSGNNVTYDVYASDQALNAAFVGDWS